MGWNITVGTNRPRTGAIEGQRVESVSVELQEHNGHCRAG